jgi:outer membrane protein OmpA-like peptidoglycan-associated protein
VTQSASSAAKTSPDKSTSRHPWLLILIFRLLLLSVGGGLALILGIVLANFYPNRNPEKPILLRVFERLDNKTPATSPNPSPTLVPDTTNQLPQLTPVERQQAQAQLTQLQAQLKALSDGLVALETQLGISRPNESLEARMQAISLQLQGVSPPSSNASSVVNSSANQPAAVSESLFQGDKLKVTLPSDVLFEESNSILRSEAGLILDKIVADLRKYPSSTIRIAHTDAAGEAEDNRELSFRRAKAVEQYLASALGKQYRWLVVGYGETRPLVANDTDANQQRNRRVEIAVN